MAATVGWTGWGVLVLLGLGSCRPAPEATQTPPQVLPQVVATSTILQDLTAQVGGEAIQLTGILQPGVDPHVYELVPADSVALEQADLILYNGLNLEPNIIKLIRSSENQAAIAVAEVVEPLDSDYQGQIEPDPHVWGDVENAIRMVVAIRDALIGLSPDDEALFTANAADLIENLEALDGWVADQIATIPADQRQLVTTHDAFQYYANAYGLTVIGTLIGISTEEQPSAQTVGGLMGEVSASGVPAIFAETTLNPALISTVAIEAGVALAPDELFSDSLGAAGSEGDSYIKMIAANTCTIAIALEGRCEPFEPE